MANDETAVPAWPRLTREADLLVWAGRLTDKLRYLESWNVVGRTLKPANPNWIIDLGSASVDWANITSKPATFPPGGTAGGDLTGTYPNPTIASGAVSWAEIAGAPTSLPGPPTGPAGGALAGTYPNPSIASKSQWIDSIAQNYSIARTNVALGHGYRNSWAVACPANYAIGIKDAWTGFMSTNITTAGGPLIIMVAPNWIEWTAGAAPNSFWQAIICDGGYLTTRGWGGLTSGLQCIPMFAGFWSTGAGAHTIGVSVFCHTNAAILSSNYPGQTGHLWIVELL